jgi:hypothetical protein
VESAFEATQLNIGTKLYLAYSANGESDGSQVKSQLLQMKKGAFAPFFIHKKLN